MAGPERIDENRNRQAYAARVDTRRAASASDDGASTNMAARVEEEHPDDVRSYGPILADRLIPHANGQPAPVVVRPADHAVAFMRATGELRAPAPPQLAVLAKSEPMGAPELVPVKELHSVAAVDAAMRDHLAYLARWSPLISPEDRAARENYVRQLRYLQQTPLAINDGRSIVAKLKDDPAKEIPELLKELRALGDSRSTPDDPIDLLRARRDELLAARERKLDDERRSWDYIGLDGHRGNLETQGRYEVQQRYDLVNPGSGTGAFYAGMAAARGASVDEIRAAAEAGNVVEGMGGGVGHVVQNRAGSSDAIIRMLNANAALRGHRPPSYGPGLGPRTRSTADNTRIERGPSPTANTPPAQSTEAPARPFRLERAKYRGPTERLSPTEFDGASVDNLNGILERRTNAARALNAFRQAGAAKERIDAARYHVITASRDIGEAAADAAVLHKFPGPPPPTKLYPPPGTPSRSGDFDQVWRVTVKGVEQRLVVEAKGGNSPKGTRQVAPGVRAEQGSPPYYAEILSSMRSHRDAAARLAGEELHGWSTENLHYLHIRTPIKEVNGQSTAPAVKVREFDLQREQSK